MLDKKYLEAYQNISAPPELKEKVMARAEEKAAEPSFIVRFGKKTKALSALAACLVCVIAFSVFWGNANAPTVFVGEQKVGSALVALADDGIAMAAMPRLMPKVSLEMNVQLKEETTVSISEGVIIVNCTKQSIIVFAVFYPDLAHSIIGNKIFDFLPLVRITWIIDCFYNPTQFLGFLEYIAFYFECIAITQKIKIEIRIYIL